MQIIFDYWLTINLLLMNTFLFSRYRNKMLYLLFVFSFLVTEYKYWKQSTSTADIVLLLANQIADIFSC